MQRKATEMEIAASRLGWTKYLAQGLVGAILRPLLGSLSATAFFATIRWEQIRGVKSTVEADHNLGNQR
jgi:hypothetical protein